MIDLLIDLLLMMRISFNFFSLGIIFLAFILFSCQFDTDEIYKDETIQPLDPPELNVIELTALPDSLFLDEPVTITFSFESTNTIYGVVVFIDEREYCTFDTGSGEFTIDPLDFNMVYHKMKIFIVTNANSGSIADKVGYEGYVFEGKDWIFFNIHRDYIPRRPLKSRSYSRQGGLELGWDSCWYRDAMYRIEKYLGNENGPLIGTSTSRNSSFSDMNYAGEKALYRIHLSGDGGSTWYPWYEITCDRDLPLPVLDIHEHHLLLHWPYKEYFQNIHGFRLKDPDGGTFQEDVAAGDTSIILEDYYFGGDKEIEFHVIPGSDPGYYHENPAAFSNISSHFFAERMPFVSGQGLFAVLNESRLLFQQNSHNVQVLDLDSYKIVDSLYSEPDMSNNDFGYSFYQSASREKFCIKSLTKNAIHYGYSDNILNHITFILPFPASTTRVFIFDDSDEIILYHSMHFYYYSTLSQTIEDTISFEGSEIIPTDDYHTFSPDGRYLLQTWYRDFYMLRVDGREFTRLYEVDDGFEEVDDWVGFDLNKPSTLIQLDGENLFFRNPGDFSIISTIPFDYGYYIDLLNLDCIHRRVLCLYRYDFFRLKVFNLDQGTMMKEIPVPNSKDYLITGNTLLSTSGLRMDFTYLP